MNGGVGPDSYIDACGTWNSMGRIVRSNFLPHEVDL